MQARVNPFIILLMTPEDRVDYLCMVACPPVKSDVACHKVCFLGCGLVSLKKSGCLANCTMQETTFTITEATITEILLMKKG